MQLSELKPSLIQLDRAEALALILSIRKSRRTIKRKLTATKKKAAVKKTPMQTLLKGLGEKDISALINMIEEQQEK